MWHMNENVNSCPAQEEPGSCSFAKTSGKAPRRRLMPSVVICPDTSQKKAYRASTGEQRAAEAQNEIRMHCGDLSAIV